MRVSDLSCGQANALVDVLTIDGFEGLTGWGDLHEGKDVEDYLPDPARFAEWRMGCIQMGLGDPLERSTESDIDYATRQGA